MSSREKIVFSWSGGKDSAMALKQILAGGRYEVVALLTSVAEQFERVSHHGVRSELLELQAAAVGLPLDKLYLPSSANHPCTNDVYEEIMRTAMLRYCEAGVRTVAFGDIFLEDLRQYRERNLATVGMQAIFPLWKRDTGELLDQFISSRWKAYISCAEAKLGPTFAGRAIDAAFRRDLPPGIDPCGEFGEYHSFVYDGPIFQRPVPVEVGEVVVRDGRFYADLLSPVSTVPPSSSLEHAMPPV